MSVSFECCACCQVEVSASGWSLIQRSPTECDVSEFDREASPMRRPWPMGGCCEMGEKITIQTFRLTSESRHPSTLPQSTK
jgi:hypothetical protein